MRNLKIYSRSLLLFLLMPVIFSDCKKADSIPDPNMATYYFKATIDGQLIEIADGRNGYGCAAGSSEGTVPAGCMEEQSLNFIKGFVPNGSVGVILLKTFSQCATECSQLEGMFNIGSYNYGKASSGSSDNGIDGVVIYYVDNDGIQWFSDKGIASQTNSNFTISEQTDNTDVYSSKITKATFHCTLYDNDGNSIPLTNGEIRSRSVQCGY